MWERRYDQNILFAIRFGGVLILFVSVSSTPSQICILSSTLILPLCITPAITGRKCEHRGFGGSRAAAGSRSIAFVRNFFQETLSIPL